ncbi:MAG: HAMP domain-containing histidine kinase [Myxococcaceae bacterium]|nr:HAMP domain-containing histidine kinase [Myxococcaceae bacterium]
MPRDLSDADLIAVAERIRRAARSVRDGEVIPRLPEGGTERTRDLVDAVNELLAAAADREQERKLIVERNQDVLLALEELAREQAGELAAQNEALRRQNAELQAADRLKNEFLATVSHELRTPLNAVIGFSELLLEGLSGALAPEQAEYVADIHHAGRHLLGMINDILDLAKMDAGRLEFQPEQIDLCGPVREAEVMARPLAMKKSQSLEVFTDTPVPCYADPQRVRQIALNLMSNAVKFTPHGGHLKVTVRPVEDGAELEVTDDGIGIDPAHHHLIFEVFRQVDGSETREYQGTGLGLALVKRFAEAMGGTVRVESAVGKGASFFVRLLARAPQVRPLRLEPATGS